MRVCNRCGALAGLHKGWCPGPAPANEPPPANGCEAERRIKQALYELELQWGAGHFDVGKLRGVLEGKPSERCTH